jgi:hypothetical protein
VQNKTLSYDRAKDFVDFKLNNEFKFEELELAVKN